MNYLFGVIRRYASNFAGYFRREQPASAYMNLPDDLENLGDSRSSEDLELGLHGIESDRVEIVGETEPDHTPSAATSRIDISPMEVSSALASIIFSRENLPRLSVAGVLTGIGTTLNFACPYLLSKTIELLSSDSDHINVGGVELSRTTLLTVLITAYSITQVVPSLRDHILIPVTNNNGQKTVQKLTGHLLKKSLDYHTKTKEQDQVFIVIKGFTLTSIAMPLLTQIGPTLAEISFACAFLTKQYGLPIGGSLLALFSSYIAYGAITAQYIVDANENGLKANMAGYQNFIGAIKKYKLMRDFGKFEETMKSVEQVFTKSTLANNTAETLPIKIGFGHYALSRLTMLVGCMYVGLRIQTGQYTPQEFIILFTYFNQLSMSMPAFGAAINKLFASYPDLKFVLNELKKSDEVVDLHPDIPLIITAGSPPSIEFKNVTFSYPPKHDEDNPRPIFHDLSFKIESGKRVAFVSESGAGKSTIFNLLFGYYQPTSGTIEIDGKDISQVSLQSRQNQITLLAQKANLFEGTVRENILYGAPYPEQVTDDAIFDMADSINLGYFLRELRSGLDTPVGENGDQLSNGQQQKVATIRGIMKRSHILMMDEITASLDSQSAAQVLAGVDGIHNVTRMMITHKLTELENLDQIIILAGRRAIAQGTHSELLESCELYQQLWAAYKAERTASASTPDHNSMSHSSSRSILEALGGAAPASGTLQSRQASEESDLSILPIVHLPVLMPSRAINNESAEQECKINTSKVM